MTLHKHLMVAIIGAFVGGYLLFVLTTGSPGTIVEGLPSRWFDGTHAVSGLGGSQDAANCNLSLKAGRSALIPRGCIVTGSVRVNDEKLYDDSPDTGLIVILTKDATVLAPYGASVTPQGENPLATADLLARDMKSPGGGCGLAAGCRSVVIKTR